MHQNALPSEPQEASGRLWHFAECEFDELRRVLRVRGVPTELEAKPLDLLSQLLLHAGEVLTKDELLESVWPGLMVVDGSLATAMSKLRKALGDEEGRIVLTVPRVGYRLGVPVHCKAISAASTFADLGLKPGNPVPGREQWRLTRPMDVSGSSEVWLAEHPKTHECRVFKFASDGAQLKGLKREVTVSRFLRESLGDRPEFVHVMEWNFDSPPYFLESEYNGPNLMEWAESHGGLRNIPLEARLRLLAEVAKAVAAAHEVGVLHKDLKPANVLVMPGASGGWQIKVADFGSASLLEPARLKELGITSLGMTQGNGSDARKLTGTLMYLAPEVLAGHAPTVSSDVYALGVMLYQLMVCDFRQPLSPGWEAGVEDPLIREDIVGAACGDPARRLNSAAEFAERLLNLGHRRLKRDELEQARRRALAAERELAEARARRPWIMLAATALVVGLAFSLVLYAKASRDRDIATRQTAIANAINQFLSDDLLGRSNPFKTGKAEETLVDAVNQASLGIDRQFKDAPLVAARLHQTIARALDSRTSYPNARLEYDRAAALFDQAEGPASQDGILLRLQRASMEARTYEAGSLPLAKKILADQEALLPKIANPRPDLLVWLATARAMVALIGNDAKTAVEQFRIALDKAGKIPDFDPLTKLTFKQRLAFSYIRLGDGPQAEQLCKELIGEFTSLGGSQNPNVLRVGLNLAQAYMIQAKHKDAIDEISAIYPSLVANLGADHELSMQALATRAESEGRLGLYDDAERDDMTIYKLALVKQGPESFFSIATLTDAALAQCRADHLVQGELNARNAYLNSVKAFGERAGLTGGTAYSLASCLIGLGKLEEAAKLLNSIDRSAVAQLTGEPDWGANVDLALAEIAFRRADYVTARKLVLSAAPAFTRPDAEAYQKHRVEMLTAALDKRLKPGQ